MNAPGGSVAGQGAGGESSENGQQHQSGQRPAGGNVNQQQLQMAMQNPQQMMQVIQAQISQLQRQWATVQTQPESPQKMEAVQSLAMNMKRMKMLQAQTTLALQHRQQQQQQQQQQGDGTQNGSGTQVSQQAGSPSAQISASEAQASLAFLQANGGAPLDASNPAHNAQLAALQAFAQQQRIQAMQHTSTGSIDGSNWQQNNVTSQPQQFASNGMTAASPPVQQQQQQQQQQFNVPQSAQSPQSSQQGQQLRQQQPSQQQQQQQQQQLAQTAKGDLVGAVKAFMAARGTPLPANLSTTFQGPSSTSPGEPKSVDLQTLFATVIQFGGSARVSQQPNGWAIVGSKLGLAVAATPQDYTPGQQNEVDGKGILLPAFVAPRLSQIFKDLFSSFEEFWLAKMRGAGGQAAAAAQVAPNGQQQQQQQPQNAQNAQNDGQQRPPSSAGLDQGSQQQQQQMGAQNGVANHQQQSSLENTGATPQMAPQQVPQGFQQDVQSGSMTSAQEALQRAQQMQAQLPKHMQQLQELINGGKLSQQEARDKFTYLQNNAKMAMLQAQAQIQAASTAALGGSDSISGSGSSSQIPSGMNTGMPQTQAPQQGMSMMQQQQQQPTFEGQFGDMSNVAGGPVSSIDSSTAQQQPQAQQMQTAGPSSTAAPTETEGKKGAKRARKSTTSSAKGGGKNAAAATAAALSSDAASRDSTTDSPTQANMAHLTMHAQQAVRFLQQGNMNLTLQVGAFAAIQTARLATQGITGVDVSAMSHTMAQVYSNYLRQAQGAGQPMHIAAPLAFSAAEMEMQRNNQANGQAGQGRQSQSSTPKMQTQQMLQQSTPQQQQSLSSSSSLSRMQQQQGQARAGSSQLDLSGPVQVPIQTPTRPNKYKIEYMPIRREVRSHGGWDLDVVERQMSDVLEGRGRFPRSVRELGHVDIESLIMSLRSRLEVEVTYALNALYILTAGVQATGFHLLLSICEDLCDELLDLLEEAADGKLYKEEDIVDIEREGEEKVHTNGHMEGKIDVISHSQWMMDIKEEDEQMQLWQRKRMKRRKILGEAEDSDDEDAAASLRQREDLRCAQVAIAIVDIFYNLAIVEDNHTFLNNESRFLQLLLRITQSVEQEQNTRRRSKAEDGSDTINGTSSPSTIFNSTEAMRIRKDVLAIIACLSGESCILTRFDTTTVIAMIDLISSFIKDASDIEKEYGTVYSSESNGMTMNGNHRSQAIARKVPQHADMALEAFSSLAQPDANRQLLGKIIEESKWVNLGNDLIKLLPINEVDFQMLKTEARLGYCERISLSLFNIAYLGSPSVKSEIKRTSGAVGVIFRCIKRLIRVNVFSRNPFAVMTRRLIETLRMLDGGDNFNRPALIGFGMESISSNREKKSNTGKSSRKGGLLAQDEVSVVEMMTVEGIDPVIISELEQLL